MSISIVAPDPLVQDVRVHSGFLEVYLSDGRILSVPVSWFPRLAGATPAQANNWEPSAAGRGIHWPDIDEDLSIAGLLRGERAPR